MSAVLSERAYALLADAVVHMGSKAAVAEAVGVSRSTVSTLLDHKYPAKSAAAVEDKILASLDRYLCPHLAEEITASRCKTYACRDCPTGNPRDLRHWRACASCHHNPKHKGDNPC